MSATNLKSYLRDKVMSRPWHIIVGRHYVLHHGPDVLTPRRARASLDGAEERLVVVVKDGTDVRNYRGRQLGRRCGCVALGPVSHSLVMIVADERVACQK